MFHFFLSSYRKNILTFCGAIVEVKYDSEGPDCKEGFRLFENGYFSKGNIPTSRHSNILLAIIVAKKSWGLHKDMWVDGIIEGSFTKREILQQFEECNITIPESLLQDFQNSIIKKIRKKNE